MTEYIVQELSGKNIPLWSEPNKKKKLAFERYSCLCEQFPKDKFRVVKRVTTEETIAESEDVRQARFEFAQ